MSALRYTPSFFRCTQCDKKYQSIILFNTTIVQYDKIISQCLFTSTIAQYDKMISPSLSTTTITRYDKIISQCLFTTTIAQYDKMISPYLFVRLSDFWRNEEKLLPDVCLLQLSLSMTKLFLHFCLSG